MAYRDGPRRGKFTEGSTMGHVVTMTLTAATGLMFMFLIDAATLFWVSQLRDETLMAALGFAWTIQFFIIGSGIGLAIATSALVSRSIGEGNHQQARRQATSSIIIAMAVQAVVVAVVLIWLRPLLSLAGAQGETLDVAARFLWITLPSTPLMALGMVGGGVLRALGDAWRAMSVTIGAGLVAMVLDPVLIFTLGLGMDGAAIAMVIARFCLAGLVMYFMVRTHDMLGAVTRDQLTGIARPFFAIAAPATLTQMSTPFGNALLTALVAGFGDGAVAGWAVVTRLTVLAFGGVFALSGAIGGILGQNYGAGLMMRVRCVYRDAVVFCAAYTVLAWGALYLSRDLVVGVFNLGPEGAEVVAAFVGLAAGGFIFTGALFVANAAFNTLGRPLWSTMFNWSRDAFFMLPLAWALSLPLGAAGVIYGQALAGVVVGGAAAWVGWRFVQHLAPPVRASAAVAPPPGAKLPAE